MNTKSLRKTVLVVATGLLTIMSSTTVHAADNENINNQIARQKEVDNGGSGRYRAIVVSEKTLPDFTVYRPRDVQYAARREGPLPILIWCNGACSGSSIGYERMLNEMASHGYVVVGIGSFEMVDSERDDGGSNEKMVVDAINWLVRQEKIKTSDYYKAIDVNNIALSGHSCGGAQAIANCANARVKTLLIMNAGMGYMSMGGASPQTLNSLHCPLIYMTGGTDDVAYENAKTDFNKKDLQRLLPEGVPLEKSGDLDALAHRTDNISPFTVIKEILYNRGNIRSHVYKNSFKSVFWRIWRYVCTADPGSGSLAAGRSFCKISGNSL